jgi:hypothetical protein
MLTGCHVATGERAQLAIPPQRTDPVHIVIYAWKGDSYGADFVRTSLWACEVDLRRQIKRTIVRVARQPEPMIAAPGGSTPEPLHAELWRAMDAEEARRLRGAVDAWLATYPPGSCDIFVPPGGRENGYMMQFRLRKGEAMYKVRANPPRSRHEAERCVPDATFWSIVGALQPRFLRT